MTLAGLLTKQVTLVSVTSTEQDEYGQPTPIPVLHTVDCYYRMLSTDDVDSVSRERIDYLVYLPAWQDTEGLVAIDIDDQRYELQGPIHLQWNPRLNRDEFKVITVRRAT